MARGTGGVLGWLSAVAPLAVINGAGAAGLLGGADVTVVGAAALLGGIVLGGIVAGALGSRGRHGQPAGAASVAVAGGVAAVLYGVTVLGLLALARVFGAAPEIVVLHPIRVSVVVASLSALLFTVALLAGAIAGRRAEPEEARPTARPSLPRAQTWDEQPAPRAARPSVPGSAPTRGVPSAPWRAPTPTGARERGHVPPSGPRREDQRPWRG